MKAIRSTALLLLFGVSCSLSLVPAVARAEDDATVEAARERFNEGVEYFDNKEYERARLAFVQAYALKPHPAILLNLAQSEVRSGHEAAAATHFAQYLREHSEATSEQRDAARQGLESAKKSVGIVTLTVDPSGAEVKVDGEVVGRSPLDDPLYLTPGEHSIVAEKGGEVARTRVDVSAGDSLNKSLSIGGSPAAAEPDTDAEAEESGDEDEDEDIEADEDDNESSYELDSDDVEGDRQPFFDWYGESPVAWVGTGLAAASLGAGIVFAISAKNYYASADDIAAEIERQALDHPNVGTTQGVCTLPWGEDPDYTPDPGFRAACKKFKDREETGDRYKKYSVISLVAAPIFVVGTVVYYFATAPSVESSAKRAPGQKAGGVKAQLIPSVGPGQAGLVVQGTF